MFLWKKLTSLRGLHPEETNSPLLIMSVAVSKPACCSCGHGRGVSGFRPAARA